MAECTCKPNGYRYGDAQFDSRGCPLHCDHSHINVWAKEWYCDCGAAWNRHRMIIDSKTALLIGRLELSGAVGYTYKGDLYVKGKKIEMWTGTDERNTSRRPPAQHR